MVDHLQERLDAAFPAAADAPLVRAVQQGILLADSVVENEAWLKGPLGRDVRGYLRRAGVLSQVHAACVSGDLPFEGMMEAMPRGPFHWVELKSQEFVAHICKTDAAGAFPEDTPTRQDERLTNEYSLFENVVPMKESAAAVGQLLAWLTFGAPEGGRLGHLCWAMPAPDGKSWLAHSNVLYRLTAAQVHVQREEPTERAKLKFRDQIAEAVTTTDPAVQRE